MELSNEYMGKIKKYCDLASNSESVLDVVEDMPSVPSVGKLREESGNYLYIGENNTLLAYNPRYSGKLLNKLIERGLYNPNAAKATVEESVTEETAFMETAENLVAEI